MARDEKIVIRLTDTVKEDFQSKAEEYGMTISALGSYVIGRFIAEEKQRKEVEKAVGVQVAQMLYSQTQNK